MIEAKLREYLEFAEELARESGDIALRHNSSEGVEIKTEANADNSATMRQFALDSNSPVDPIDVQVNQLFIAKAPKKYPNIGVLSEEGSKHGEQTDGLLWVCDPHDGSIPHALGMRISTICVALVMGGSPIVGAINDYAHGLLYSAATDLGAFCNGRPLEKPAGTPLPFVEVESWHSAPNDVSGLLNKLKALQYQTPNFASHGYMSLLVATGKIRGTVYAGDKPWDVAAAKVILNELGFEVTDIYGNDQRYDQPIKGAIVGDESLLNQLLGREC